jgi:hypothetical protein
MINIELCIPLITATTGHTLPGIHFNSAIIQVEFDTRDLPLKGLQKMHFGKSCHVSHTRKYYVAHEYESLITLIHNIRIQQSPISILGHACQDGYNNEQKGGQKIAQMNLECHVKILKATMT